MLKVKNNKIVKKVINIYQRVTSKKYSTLAGTLVFFLVLSIIPFIFIATIFLNIFSVNFDFLVKLDIFASYKQALTLILNTAQSATSGVSIFFIISAIYAATNFFYHMRRSGEIIYNYPRKKKGVIIRFSAAALVFVVLFILALFAGVFLSINILFESMLPKLLYRLLIYLALLTLSFIVLVILNLYICPYKNTIKNTFKGSLFTLLFWVASTIGITFYTKYFGSFKLYGAMAFIMVFLLWLQFMMQGLIIGVIINMKYTTTRLDKKY